MVKNFIFFPDALQQDDETKIIARPPQFFAATKLHHNIKLHMKPHGDGKGGTYFGTTGCGMNLNLNSTSSGTVPSGSQRASSPASSSMSGSRSTAT